MMQTSVLAYYWRAKMPNVSPRNFADAISLKLVRGILRSPYTLAEIAGRIGKTARWVQARIESPKTTLRDVARIASGADFRLTLQLVPRDA